MHICNSDNNIYPSRAPGRTFAQSFTGGLVTFWFVWDLFKIVLGFT